MVSFIITNCQPAPFKPKQCDKVDQINDNMYRHKLIRSVMIKLGEMDFPTEQSSRHLSLVLRLDNSPWVPQRVDTGVHLEDAW